MPLFARDGSVARDCLWWQHEGNRAIRIGAWKLVAAGAEAPWELYDLETDRGESRNLASERPDTARELEKVWKQHFEEFRRLASKDLSNAPSVEP